MPAIAIVGAIGGIAAGASAIAAAGGLAAMGIGAAIAAGAAIAGGAITIAGVVTGNKKLMQLGSILGVVGGVASLASGAASSAGAAASTLADDVAAQAASAASMTGGLDAAAAMTVPTLSTATAAATEFGNQLAQLPGVSTVAPVTSSGLIGDAIRQAPAEPLQSAATTVAENAPTASRAAEQAAAGASVQPPAATGIQGLAKGSELGVTGKLGDSMNSVWNFIKDKGNAEVVKLGSGVIGGAMNAYQGHTARSAEQQRMQKALDSYNNSIIGQRTFAR